MTKHLDSLDSVLIIDDDTNFSALIGRWLEKAGFRYEIFADGKSCLDELATLYPTCVCLDLTLPGENGFEILRKLQSRHPYLPVIILTADSFTENAVKAIQLGAYDYLVKPIDRDKLVTAVANAVERFRLAIKLYQLEDELEGKSFCGLIGDSPPMRELYRQTKKAAASDITILIQGESGTGKELFANALHRHSGRADAPFIALNCAAIPESLQESELFGHEKGSFSGAIQRRKGKFELADGGTLFLDEVAELSFGLQAKLLRVLQEKTFHRVGGSENVSSDFRLIAASHKNLYAEVEAGNFREDLFFRLAVYELEVPPLRERREDIITLTGYFLGEMSRRHHRNYRISPEAMSVLHDYEFSGNVRELQNYIQRALITSSGDMIELADLPKRLLQPKAEVCRCRRDNDAALPAEARAANENFLTEIPAMSLENLEKIAIKSAIKRHLGNLSNVAEELGIGRSTLYRKIKEFEINA